jgi:hypothetical protein
MRFEVLTAVNMSMLVFWAVVVVVAVIAVIVSRVLHP